MVRGFRKDDNATPIVLMGYYNPIYIYGVDRFLADAKAAGVDGLIVVDLPPEEDDRALHSRAEGGTQFHPSRDADHRRPAPAGRAREHLGLRLLRLDHRHHRQRQRPSRTAVGEAVARIKRHTELPVGVGFGIRTPDAARAIAANADGAVVGTALVDALREQPRCGGPRNAQRPSARRRSGGGAGAGRAGSEAGRRISHNCVE